MVNPLKPVPQQPASACARHSDSKNSFARGKGATKKTPQIQQKQGEGAINKKHADTLRLL